MKAGDRIFGDPPHSHQATLPRPWRIELRDRLNVFLGFIELLADDPALSPQSRRFAENVRAAGTHLLLALARERLDGWPMIGAPADESRCTAEPGSSKS